MSEPENKMNIPITRPVLGESEERAVVEVLRSGWLVQGPRVGEFERAVADYVGARHAVATSSCTTALHLTLLLHGIGPGDEVVVPSFTFIATANVVRYVGARPVFADVEYRTGNIDPKSIETAITPKTKAIIVVHQLGLAADMDAVDAIARRYGLIVIEDAAPALGAYYKGRRVGSLGHSTCFSFHPRKAITSAEGGMIVTDDASLADQARVLRTHGMSVSDLARHEASKVVIEKYDQLGFNYRMSDLHAAVGLQQLRRLDQVLADRRRLAERYNQAFGDLDCVRVPFSSAETPHTYQSYMLTILPEAEVSRDDLMAKLLSVGIQSRRGVMAVHLESCYSEFRATLPVTEMLSSATILLPLYPAMTNEEQDFVIKHVRRFVVRR